MIVITTDLNLKIKITLFFLRLGPLPFHNYYTYSYFIPGMLGNKSILNILPFLFTILGKYSISVNVSYIITSRLLIPRSEGLIFFILKV